MSDPKQEENKSELDIDLDSLDHLDNGAIDEKDYVKDDGNSDCGDSCKV